MGRVKVGEMYSFEIMNGEIRYMTVTKESGVLGWGSCRYTHKSSDGGKTKQRVEWDEERKFRTDYCKSGYGVIKMKGIGLLNLC